MHRGAPTRVAAGSASRSAAASSAARSASRTRCRDADLAAELAAALREALPTTTRVGAPRCMWLLANAKLERTLLCRVNLKS